MFDQLKKQVGEDAGDTVDLSKIPISAEPDSFYADFGRLLHPRTGKPVPHLAPYQIETWKALLDSGRVLVVKSNKIGLSTSTLMADFQLAVLPSRNPRSCRGYDQLLIAQTIQHAREHLYTLRKMILESSKYRPWLITKSRDMVLKDEATKVTVLYIRNPENENRPSRIIGLGLNNAGSILSWKNVKHIHISDPTAAEGDYTPAINAAMTRLANTGGSMVIETVPAGPQGRIYELYRQFKGAPGGDAFRVFEIPASEAVKAGVIAQEFLDAERLRLGGLYAQYYEARFVSAAGSIFLSSHVDGCVTWYGLAREEDSRRVMAVDWGFGSSKTAVVGVERRADDRLYVIECRQFERSAVSDVLDFVAMLYHRDGYSCCYADGSQPGIIRDLKEGSAGRPAIDAYAVVFRDELSDMLQETIRAVKDQKVLIHPEFAEIIQELKAIQYDRKGNPDKSAYSMDLFDAFMMAVSHSQDNGLYIAKI